MNNERKVIIANDQDHYWRVVIGRKDERGPILEIGAFKNKEIADGYMRNIVKNMKEWDDNLLAVDRLLYPMPPCTDSEDLTRSKIQFLLNIPDKCQKENV